ncbi:MAG: PEP/pyruvate-binding domain-containing protein [Spirochaetota bacterium]|nr:PEP/pyruvate-binding domain-containing protein [Spirochaetota bacterium]
MYFNQQIEESGIPDIRNLLLPLQNKIGATQKVKSLIEELSHPNIDWKYVTNGIRSYLFDYIYDITPYSDSVLPIIFYYLKEATLRKKESAYRASDTFFDRFMFIIKDIMDGNEKFLEIKSHFDLFAYDYIHLMIDHSKEGFYFAHINKRILLFGDFLIKANFLHNDLLDKICQFLLLQYKIYIKISILTNDQEIEELEPFINRKGIGKDIIDLLLSVSGNSYNDKLKNIENKCKYNPCEIITNENELLDFSHNSTIWVKICLLTKKYIEEGLIKEDDVILNILAYLIKKSNEGNDKDLQLFMSRTLSSVCSVLVKNDKTDLLKNVINLIMPSLLTEIERGGNYFSAFSTIYNIGETVIKSENIFIIDHFEDILVKSKFSFPEFTGIATDWSVIVNSSHLENIRTWIKLIALNPSLMKKLSASLIVNLKLGGVFLRDTDVFQRDISKLLDSDYEDVFYLIISLAAVFPAFYHDIGATGNIRAFTEKIDTNHQMNDPIHFIRKQVHVESSSRTVSLIQKTMEFWMTGDKTTLINMVPSEVYDNLDNFYRLINLDTENAPKMIYKEAQGYFSEFSDERFWDFLNSVDHKEFLDFVENNEFHGVNESEKKDSIIFFTEYFNTKIPAEMTKMLHHIQNLFGIDTSKTKIWQFLYEISDDDFREMFENVSKRDFSRINIEKFIIFLHVYRMLFDKYNFSEVRAIEKLEQYKKENLFQPKDDFFDKLKGDNLFEALEHLLELQYSLKKNILLSKEIYEPLDTIVFKRHIAFGIPSMFGSYKEKKFDTLKVFFHMNLIRVRLFETIIEKLDIVPNIPINFKEIKHILKMFFRTFFIDGLSNQDMVYLNNLLDTPNMTVSQFRDIVTHMLTVHGEIADRFNETYKYVCKEAVLNIGTDKISELFLFKECLPDVETVESIEIIVDRFLRNQIMQSPLLQLFDNLLIKLRDNLINEIGNGNDIVCYNKTDNAKSKGGILYEIKRSSMRLDEGMTYAPIWEIGSKAHGLFVVENTDGIKTPEGIVLTSDLIKRIRIRDLNNPRFISKFVYQLKRLIDEFTNNRFAKPEDPMLLSVRSGAVFSMPGVMDTITNVGITKKVLDHYSQKDSWFAYDCYRRLIQDLAISYYNMDRRVFENLMIVAKEEAGVNLKERMTGKQMEDLTTEYINAVKKEGHFIPEDPYEQLLYAIIAVYKSWESNLAKKYRGFVNISDQWHTSVIIQRMVFGNLSPSYITGVAHGQYLGHENISLFGEYKTRAQGHDIVSGVAKVFPISEEQKKRYAKSSLLPSLEKTYPEIYKKIFDAAKIIRDRWGSEVEIEFTVENDIVYILQVRGMTNHVFKIEELVESTEDLQNYLLGQGLAASGGAISGRVVFDIERIDYIREKYKGDKVILVRPETNPEDVIGIKKSDGILTCIGGMTSHAVLQMRRLEKSGVSDFSMMKIDELNNLAIVNNEILGNESVIIKEGDFIAIDGHTGHVYQGFHKTVEKGL